jgi:hypothetical protein
MNHQRVNDWSMNSAELRKLKEQRHTPLGGRTKYKAPENVAGRPLAEIQAEERLLEKKAKQRSVMRGQLQGYLRTYTESVNQFTQVEIPEVELYGRA